jgi:alpha-L-fucosidase 2
MNKTLKFDSPACCFEESLLLGNGFLGAAVYGGIGTERYSMNEATLWTGFPQDAKNPEAKDSLKKAQEFIKIGNYTEAINCIEQGFTGSFSQTYLPLCSIYIENEIEQTDSYNRTLDMETGVLKVDYTNGEQKVSRESFISNPDRIMVIKIKQKNVPLTQIYIKSELQCNILNCEKGLILRGTAPYYDHPVGRRILKNKRPFYYEDDARKGMRYKGILKVESDGELRFNGDYIELLNATEAVIYFTAATSYNGFYKHPYLEGVDCDAICDGYMQSAKSKSYETLKKSHTNDFSSLFNRTDFSLCENSSTLNTDELLKEHKSNALYELLFNLGKYLTISGSRQGGQPMNLQGIWNELVAPPWNSNYTININTQMNYLPTIALNLAECFEPYIQLAKELAINGRKIAKEWYGVDGVISHHNTDLWRIANPVGYKNKGSHIWSFFNTSYGWILWGLKEKFIIEKDFDYLNETLYPLITECAETYISLFTEDENKRLYLCPATSPENTFFLEDKTTKCALTKHTAINNAICRDTLFWAAELSKILGKDEAEKRFNNYAKRVVPYELTSDGRIMEWDKEHPESEIEHRHVSHLYGLHPARDITPYSTPELANAAKKSLDVRGDKGTGWCIAWKANMWARLFDGNRALKLLDNQLQYVKPVPNQGGLLGGTYPNLLCAHPPFQIDGNFGATAAIIEMLVQVNGKDLFVLPALPDKWQSGEIKGIKIAGGATIDLKWKDGKATQIDISPKEMKDYYNIIQK